MVTPAQLLAHPRLGAILYTWPRHWVFHDRQAGTACEDLRGLVR